MKNLSVIGKGYHTEEKVVGFYNVGDRVKFWGLRGAFWGGLWGLFFGGLFMTVPVIGNVVVLGYLASVIIAAIDNALVVGAFTALGATIYSIGVPKDSVIQYEEAVKADGFLIMAHGAVDEVARAKAILGTSNPSKLTTHLQTKALKPANQYAYTAPVLKGKLNGGAWTLWETLALGRPEFGMPWTFDNHIDESKWLSFTITLHDPALLHIIRDLTGNSPGEGGLVTFVDSNWLFSIVVPYQPHFIDQPDNVSVLWGYGLSIDKRGNFVHKSM